jgi:Holliday junction resolvase RusA-like endonuclease
MLFLLLYGELYSKKNSKRCFVKNGRTYVLPSKVYEKNKKAFLQQLCLSQDCKRVWQNILNFSKERQGTEYPLSLKVKIFRKTRRQFDYINIIQGLQDILVEAGYLPDDSAKYFIPSFETFEVDSKNPRVILYVN